MNKKLLFLLFFLFLPFIVFIKLNFIKANPDPGYEYYYPIANQNFTSDASGWIYGEENDVNNMASGAWSSSGGRIDPGSYNFHVADNSATAIAIVNQYINYSFSVKDVSNLISATAYASFHLTCTDDQLVYAKLNLITPSGNVVNLWTSQTWKTTAALDTGWINVTVDVLSNFTTYGTGTYQLSLMVHTETDGAGANTAKTTCDHYLDDAGVQLVYLPQPPIWSNLSQSTNKPGVGAQVKLSAYWTDNTYLDKAWLSTNETGTWQNYSFIDFNKASSGWSNFTWYNPNVPAGTVVAWRIYANDTFGNENATDIMTFTVQPVYLLVNLTFPYLSIYSQQNPFLIAQNNTFFVNATVTCFSEGDDGECNSVIASVRYNSTSLPDTPISTNIGATPFWYEKDVKKVSSGTNYVINGGFESGNTNGWIIEAGLQSPTIQTIGCHDGSYCFGALGSSSTTSTANALYWRIIQNASSGFNPIEITDDLYFSIWIYGSNYAEYSYTNVTLGFDDGTIAIIAYTLGMWSSTDSTYLGGNPGFGYFTKLLSRIKNYKSSGKIINITIEVRKGPDSYLRYYPTVIIDSISIFNGTILLINSQNLNFSLYYPAKKWLEGYNITTNFIDYASIHQGATVTASSSVTGNGYDCYVPAKAIDDLAFNESYIGASPCGKAYWKSNNEGSGAWINISFPTAVTINRIDLWDPPTTDNITSGHILFEDGSIVYFGRLPPDGSTPLKITFPPKITRWIKIVIDSVEGVAGLLEVDAYSYLPQDKIFVHTFTFPEGGINSSFDVYDVSGKFFLFNKSFSNIMGGDVYNSTGFAACGYLKPGETCQVSWLINATGQINSFWLIDVNFSSSAAIPQNDTNNVYIKIVFATREINIIILNETGLNEKTIAKLLDENYNLMYSFSKTHKQPLEYFKNYSIEISQLIKTSNLTVIINQINVTQDLNLLFQIVENYTGYLPSSISNITSIFSFNDTNIIFSNSTLYIPKEGINVNKILHCLNWDFSNSNCSKWEIKTLNYYNAQQNSSHIWFTVNNFFGYAGGYGYNANLTIYDDTDFVSKDINQNITFYANYSDVLTGKPINGTNVYCNISFNISGTWTPYEQMIFNTTSLLYEYTRSFSERGTFYFKVICDGSSLGYDILEANDTFQVGLIIEAINVTFDYINFTNVKPQEFASADGNVNLIYNITNIGNVALNIWIKADNLTNETLGYIIPASNLYANSTFSSALIQLSNNYILFYSNLQPQQTLTIFFYLQVPSVLAGIYKGKIYFCGNYTSLC